MSVLQSVWLEVLVLGVAYRSLGCEDEVVFAEDFVLDEEMSRVAGLTELNAAISQLARRFRALNVDREEYVMLKAIALTNSGKSLRLCSFSRFTHINDPDCVFWLYSTNVCSTNTTEILIEVYSLCCRCTHISPWLDP